jgi:hypothetical protein
MLPRTPLTENVGLVLCRAIIPLWIFLGVFFKLKAGDPRLLPGVIWQTARDWGIDLGTLLYTLIGLEIFAIGVMLFIARLAKPMAIFMLASFCLILIGEMIRGADSCGCFGGAITVKPWQMFIADFALLIAVVMFPIRRAAPAAAGDEPTPAPSLAGTAALGILLLVIGIGASFTLGSVLHPDRVQEVEDEPDDPEMTVEEREQRDRARNPSPRALPGFWYVESTDAWIGRPWREVEIFQFMPRWPSDLDEGTRYVVFYSRTCEHCWDMFEEDFTQELAAPVVAIEVPYSRDAVTSPDAWPMPPEDQLVAIQQHMHLPLRTEWIIQSPMALRIEDGIVTCATEGDHKSCLELE